MEKTPDNSSARNQPPRRADGPLRPSLIHRLILYCDFVQAYVKLERGTAISSSRMGGFLGVDAAMVRKDMAAIGVRGSPRKGFVCDEILRTIRAVLGLDRPRAGVMLGAGNLGRALALYPGLRAAGLHLKAVFDVDYRVIGTEVGGLIVEPLAALPGVVERERAEIGVLAVPASAAQRAADRLVEARIRAIWNFAPATLCLPPDITVRYESITNGLAELLHFLHVTPPVDGDGS